MKNLLISHEHKGVIICFKENFKLSTFQGGKRWNFNGNKMLELTQAQIKEALEGGEYTHASGFLAQKFVDTGGVEEKCGLSRLSTEYIVHSKGKSRFQSYEINANGNYVEL
tara:strand:- start:104 stop:436 length:333 start_codon:yes stop_codon:yes gene_type:complete